MATFLYSPASMNGLGRAISLAVLLAALCAPAGLAPLRAAGDEGLALIHGIIYRGDEATRLPGALVTAINVSTGRRYSSVHTGTNGAYEIAGLPAGTYDIAIDTPDDNLYVTDGLIELQENQRLLLSLSLKKNGGAVPGGPSRGEATQSFTDPGAVPFQPASTGPAPAGVSPTETGDPAGKPADKKSSSEAKKSKEQAGSSSKEPAPTATEEAKPLKKSKKPVGTKPKTGSGATAGLRVDPDSPFTLS